MAILTHAQQIAKAERFIAQKKDRETQGRERNLRNLAIAQEAQAKRRRAQAGLVALDHAQGMTLAQLAQKYRTSIPAIQEKLKHADRYHLLENYTAATINELVPQAMAVYDQTMSDLYHEVNKTVIKL